MTTANVGLTHHFSIRGIWENIVHEPSVTKWALSCATVVIGMVLASIAYIVAHGGDVAVVAASIGAVVSTLIASGAKVLMSKRSGNGDS